MIKKIIGTLILCTIEIVVSAEGFFLSFYYGAINQASLAFMALSLIVFIIFIETTLMRILRRNIPHYKCTNLAAGAGSQMGG
jgi:hypothetical protein